jgi:hypothetical protein
MYKGNTGEGEGTLTINDGSYIVWTSDEAAETDVTFPKDLWSVNILFNSAPSSGNWFKGYLQEFDPDSGGYDTIHLWNWQGDDSTTNFTASFIPDTSFTIDSGHRLAFRINNPHEEASESLVVKVGSNFSYVTSPTSDPGYPTPELSTIVLMSAGLVAIAIMFFATRKRIVKSFSGH